MKIYLLQIDAFPYNDELKTFSSNNNFTKLPLITNGQFTIPTVNSIMTGCLGSDLMDNGIAYHCHTSPRWLNWIKKYKNLHIHEIAHLQGFKSIINNFYDYFWGTFDHVKYNQPYNDLLKDKSFTDKNITNTSFIGEPHKRAGLVYSEEKENWLKFKEEMHIGNNEYFKREKKYINTLQSSDDDLFFHSNLWFHHEYVYRNLQPKDDSIKKTFEWLNLWDFNEPDSLFIIYSDHGFSVKEMTEPKDFLTWCFIKDNTINKLNINRKIICSSDIYSIILDKMNYTNPYNFIEGESIQKKLNKNRIYYSEDSRGDVDVLKCLTATAVQIIDWYDDNYPKELLQVTYNKSKKKYHYFTLNFDKNDYNPYIYKKIDMNDEENNKYSNNIKYIKDCLVERIKWLKK